MELPFGDPQGVAPPPLPPAPPTPTPGAAAQPSPAPSTPTPGTAAQSSPAPPTPAPGAAAQSSHADPAPILRPESASAPPIPQPEPSSPPAQPQPVTSTSEAPPPHEPEAAAASAGPPPGASPAPAPRPIAPKEYYSISEVCDLVGLKPHVLRYWESQFPVLNPSKNRSGNRVYQRKEIKLVMLVQHLLYKEKYTIEGARQRLEQLRRGGELGQAASVALDAESRKLLREELQQLLHFLERGA